MERHAIALPDGITCPDCFAEFEPKGSRFQRARIQLCPKHQEAFNRGSGEFLLKKPDPAPVYQMEENGPANMLFFIRQAKEQAKPINLAYVRYQAILTARFCEKLERGEKLDWHTHTQQEKANGLIHP